MNSQINALLGQAIHHFEQGNLDAAQQVLSRVLQMHAKNFDALHILGVIKGLQNDQQEAIRLFKKAITIDANNNFVQFNLAKALNEVGKDEEAMPHHKKAVQLAPGHVEAWLNYGAALSNLKRYEEALHCYDKIFAINPRYDQAWTNCGVVLYKLARYEDALTAFDKSLALTPDNALAWLNSGAAFNKLKRYEAAVGAYEKALSFNPNQAETWFNYGIALRQLERNADALAAYERALTIDPELDQLYGNWLLCKMAMSDWANLDQAVATLRSSIDAGKQASEPFVLFMVSDDPVLIKRYAEAYTGKTYPDCRNKVTWPVPAQDQRIKIGYYSADLHNHATAYLMAELFEKHDRSRFEIIAFSYGAHAEDAMRMRLVAAMDQFIDVGDKSDEEIVALSRSLGIDIGVDLKGYTQDGRMGIFALGAAPVQVSYLGYPGTVGAGYLDYIVADATLIPHDMATHYCEKIVRMPHSYQVNDRSRQIADKQFSRKELGLPEQGFVFTCFNNNYKLAPESFDIWMKLLHQVPGSVLWLLQDNLHSADNLRAQAQRCGIASERLVFAPRMEITLHLARHRQADLFLDTFNYNAHTTTSDALWTGLPVLTRLGHTFSSRVAASLLNAAGLPELITGSNEEYAALALKLANDAELLGAYRRRLEANRLTCPLFDSDLFTRHLETAYQTMQQRRLAGLPPDHIDIAG